jgi:type I restriction enzyme S subunit
MTAKKSVRALPKLRFPEFSDEPPWECPALGKLAKRVTKRNSDGAEPRALTNSAEHGVVDQKDFFDKVIAVKTDSYFVVEEGDYVYNPRVSAKAPVGPISKNQVGRGVMSPLYTVFRFRNETNDYFAHYFKSSNWHEFLRRVSNSGARHDRMAISNDDYMQMPIPTPAPREQQKIADCLDSLDYLIAAESQKLDALWRHKQGLFQQLFPQEGETNPRLRLPEFQNAGEWKEKKLDGLAKRGSGHTPSKNQTDYYNGGIKWVSLADSARLDKGLIYETAIEISERGIKNSSAVVHPAGSVILSRDAGVGKSAIINSPMAVSQHFIAWNCDPTRLSNWFLYYQLQLMKPLFEDIATGSTIKTIGLPYFKAMQVKAPQLDEQQRIAEFLSSLENLLAAQLRKLESLKSHKFGLLQQLFPSLDGNVK